MKKEKITIIRYNEYQNNDNYEDNVYKLSGIMNIKTMTIVKILFTIIRYDRYQNNDNYENYV